MNIFVYGTLKKGYHNHGYLEGSTFLGFAKTEPIYTMHSNKYYPIVQRRGTTPISGEVYKVEEKALPAIFALEGYTGTKGHPDNWYDTDVIETEFGKASIFVMGKIPNGTSVVESGVF
jgi:gamma-glutamylaminecyclotransferase